jgi:hypothetical protein
MREAIKEDEGGNQGRAPPVWKGPSAHLRGNQRQSVVLSGNQWYSIALTEPSAQTSLAADWVVREDVLVTISLISGISSAASPKPSSRSEGLPETTLVGAPKLGS